MVTDYMNKTQQQPLSSSNSDQMLILVLIKILFFLELGKFLLITKGKTPSSQKVQGRLPHNEIQNASKETRYTGLMYHIASQW